MRRVPGNGATTHNEAHSQAERRPQLRQVVLVDRDVDALREVAIALRDQFDFHVTISGHEALTLLQSGAIDAIVVGQTLYSSTGLNVLAEARRRAPHTQRVLLANAVEATDIERDSAPAQPFRILGRPCTPQKLLELLDAADETPASAPIGNGVTTNARQPRAAAQITPVPTTRTPVSQTVAPMYQGDYEHVVLETRPDLPRRRSIRAAPPTNQTTLALDPAMLPVVVYTDNGEFYQSVCAALQDDHDIRLATQLERVVEMSEMGACPILITDRAGNQTELQRISIALRAAEPALVTIAAGTPSEGLALRKLLNTPALHSFLPKPLSAPLVRLTVESAKRQYIQAKTPTQLSQVELADTPTAQTPYGSYDRASPELPAMRTGSHAQHTYRPMQVFEQNFNIEDRFDFRRLLPYAGVAALVLAMIAGGVWYYEHRTQADAQVAVLIDAELELAQHAYDAGDYVTPDNANALYFYRRVLQRDPTNARALRGVDSISERLVEQTERELTADKLDAASASLAVLRDLRPEYKGLAFLQGQLDKANTYRRTQKVAEQSVETARAEAATATAANTRLLESRSIDSQSSSLISNGTQRSQAVNRWLTSARQRLSQGRLVAPEADSAEYFFRLAERADPNNAAVDRGLREIGAQLIKDSQDALSRQQLDVARRRLADAGRFGPDANVIARIQAGIDAAQSANVRSNFLRLAIQRTRDNAVFEPTQDSAKYYLSQLERLDPNSPEVQQATRAIALKLIDNANQAIGQRQFNTAIRLLDETRRLGFSGIELSNADDKLALARNPPAAKPREGADIPPPRIVKSVPTKFPEDAKNAGVSGWVDVGFKINASGDVYDTIAMASSPSGAYAEKFKRAAIAAISQYKFERRNISETQTQTMVVRVQFKLE